MTKKPLHDKARGDADNASPLRGKGVPQQQSGHAEAGADQPGAAAAGAVHTAAARGHTGTPTKGQREVRMNVADRRPLPCPSDLSLIHI